jgi:hypothetical protein
MFFVQVRLNSLDLPDHMSQMRTWLDANGIETAGFPTGNASTAPSRASPSRRRRKLGRLPADLPGALFQADRDTAAESAEGLRGPPQAIGDRI